MKLEKKINPCGGDKNLDDNALLDNIIKEIITNLKNNITPSNNKRDRDNDLLKYYNKGELEILYSEYVFPLVSDCSMHHCPHGGAATGYIFKSQASRDEWAAEFECPRDDYFQVSAPNIEKLVNIILSDERNFIRIL